MRLLLDTQAFVCIELFPERLPDSARVAIEESNNTLYLSVVSAIELQIKINLNRFRFEQPLRQVIEQRLAAGWCQLLPINLPHVEALSQLPSHHRDPFDRLLVAQAMVEDLTIVTGDEIIQRYPAPTLWK